MRRNGGKRHHHHHRRRRCSTISISIHPSHPLSQHLRNAKSARQRSNGPTTTMQPCARPLPNTDSSTNNSPTIPMTWKRKNWTKRSGKPLPGRYLAKLPCNASSGTCSSSNSSSKLPSYSNSNRSHHSSRNSNNNSQPTRCLHPGGRCGRLRAWGNKERGLPQQQHQQHRLLLPLPTPQATQPQPLPHPKPRPPIGRCRGRRLRPLQHCGHPNGVAVPPRWGLPALRRKTTTKTTRRRTTKGRPTRTTTMTIPHGRPTIRPF